MADQSPKLTISMLTREMIRLTRGYLDGEIKYEGDAWPAGSPAGAMSGLIQRSVESEMSDEDFGKSIDAIAEKKLHPLAAKLASTIKNDAMQQFFKLVLPSGVELNSGGVTSSCSHVYDGLALRGLVLVNEKNCTVRFDVCGRPDPEYYEGNSDARYWAFENKDRIAKTAIRHGYASRYQPKWCDSAAVYRNILASQLLIASIDAEKSALR